MSNVAVPTPTAFTNPVTVPLSPGPTSCMMLVVIVLSVFLVYPLPADGAEPPVLLVGVNPSVSYTHLTLPTICSV